jgi:hypothetical protein
MDFFFPRFELSRETSAGFSLESLGLFLLIVYIIQYILAYFLLENTIDSEPNLKIDELKIETTNLIDDQGMFN